MKKLLLGVAVIALGVATFSCKNEDLLSEETLDAYSSARVAADSLRQCADSLGHGFRVKKTEIAVSTLPSTVTTYITTNYAGATIEKAYQEDASKNYLVVIKQNDTNKILSFSSAGAFLKELKKGSKGKFNHEEIAIADIPKAITDYITANYAGATVHAAFKDVNQNTVVVIKTDTTAKVLVFDVNNAFVKEREAKAKGRKGKKG